MSIIQFKQMIPNITPDILRPYKSGHKKPSRKPVDMDGSSVSHTEVFPNPTSNLLTIRSKNNELINAVGIYSIDGAMVFNNQNIISNIFSTSVQNLKTGFYLVYVKTKEKTETFKIIKQ